MIRIPDMFDVEPDPFVLSCDPDVHQANSAEALAKYQQSGMLADLDEVPDSATRFWLEPLDPGAQAAAMAMAFRAPQEAWQAALQAGKPGGLDATTSERGAEAIQALMQGKIAVVGTSLRKVSGWEVDGKPLPRSKFKAVLRAMYRRDAVQASAVVSELYDRVQSISGLSPLGKAPSESASE